MAAPGGGQPPPSPPISTDEAFQRLVSSSGKKTVPIAIPKFIKKLETVPEIELPADKPMKAALALAERGLVGQFMGLWPSPKTTDGWIQRNWRPLLKNSVICYPVGRGFYIFEFTTKEDRDLIFRNGPYFMGAQGLYLNKWTPDFDPESDVAKEVPVWVRLPNLPVHCWNNQTFEKIGNVLGKYIDKAENKGQYTCARICVEVDLEAGLPEAIKLKVGTWHRYQKLDYEQLPFKCRLCHEHGHFQRDCPKAKPQEDEEGWQKVKKGKTASKPQEKKTSGDMQKNKSAPDSANPPSNGTHAAKETQKTKDPADLPSVSVEDSHGQPMQNKKAKEGQDKDPLEPGEILQSDSEEMNSTGSPKETNENSRPLETDQEEDTDGETASSSHQTSSPPNPRGRKSKKKIREEVAKKDVSCGLQKTIPGMQLRLKKGNASKGATPNLHKS